MGYVERRKSAYTCPFQKNCTRFQNVPLHHPPKNQESTPHGDCMEHWEFLLGGGVDLACVTKISTKDGKKVRFAQLFLKQKIFLVSLQMLVTMSSKSLCLRSPLIMSDRAPCIGQVECAGQVKYASSCAGLGLEHMSTQPKKRNAARAGDSSLFPGMGANFCSSQKQHWSKACWVMQKFWKNPTKLKTSHCILWCHRKQAFQKKKLGRGGRPYCALVKRRSGQACAISLLARLCAFITYSSNLQSGGVQDDPLGCRKKY